MKDIPKFNIDPANLSSLIDLKNIGNKKQLRPNEYGHIALSDDGIIEMRYQGRGIESPSSRHDRPGFYESEKLRGTQFVDMDARGEVVVSADEERRIATFGLGGCTAVAVTAEYADGTRKGYVQHYSPLNKSVSAAMLERAAIGIVNPTEPVSTRAVIMTPGKWSANPGNKYTMEANDTQLTSLLTATAQAGLRLDTDIQILPYSVDRKAGKYGQGTLMVEFSPNGQTNIYAENMAVKPTGETR